MAISPEQVAYQRAHIHESKTSGLIGSTAALTAVATVLVFARFVARRHAKLGLKADDYLILLALILSWGAFVAIYMCGQNGLGRHAISVTKEEWPGLGKSLYADVLLFPVTIMVIQLSFLFFYIRIFTLQNRRFRIALYICAGLSTSIAISQVVPTIVKCWPIAYVWDKTISGGRCIDSHVMYIVQDILILVVDVYVVVLPLPSVWNLHITRTEKIAVSGIFLLGGFIAVVNLIRLPQLIHTRSEDVTYTDVGAAIWSQAECCLGIVAACLPCLRPLMFLMFTSVKRVSSLKQDPKPWSAISWRRGKGRGSYQMHSIQRDLDTPTQRLSPYAAETWTAPSVAHAKRYPGQNIKTAAVPDWEREASNDSDADLEKGPIVQPH